MHFFYFFADFACCSKITITNTTSRWPVVPLFCLSCSSLFSLLVTCGDPHDCCLCALLSLLRFVTASWLKVKESFISFWWRSISIPQPCLWKCCAYNHGSCEFDTSTVPAVHRQDLRIGKQGWLRCKTHAEAQQEQIRMTEVVIQQLRANPMNPSPPIRAAFQKPVTEGGAFKALTKYTGKHSEYHDWSFSARRVVTRADERFAEVLHWIFLTD